MFFFHFCLGIHQSCVLFPKTARSVCLVLPKVSLLCWLPDSETELPPLLFLWVTVLNPEIILLSLVLRCSLTGVIARKHN